MKQAAEHLRWWTRQARQSGPPYPSPFASGARFVAPRSPSVVATANRIQYGTLVNFPGRRNRYARLTPFSWWTHDNKPERGAELELSLGCVLSLTVCLPSSRETNAGASPCFAAIAWGQKRWASLPWLLSFPYYLVLLSFSASFLACPGRNSGDSPWS